MKSEEIRNLLQKYYNAEATADEEKRLESYFSSNETDIEFQADKRFFEGISELARVQDKSSIEDEVMNFILEQEKESKPKYRLLWKAVTGIAASLLFIVSGYIIYENQRKPFSDTFSNPKQAIAYAEQTLRYVSSKYNKGLVQLTNFDKIEKASLPLKKGMKPLNDFLAGIEKIKNEERANKN